MQELLADEPVAEVLPGDLQSKAESVRLAPSPTPPHPLISDDEQDMVESFVAGYCFCPEEYREVFYESWAKSHPEDHRLLFTAWLAVDHFEGIRAARGKVAGR